MEKIINYTIGLHTAFPEECICGGVQGEHRATALYFSPDAELAEVIEAHRAQGTPVWLQIDAVSLSGELAETEKREGDNLFAPFYLTSKITSSGLDCIIVVRIFVGGEKNWELCKAQMQLYFTPSPIGLGFSIENKGKNDISKKAEEIMLELTEKAEEIEQTLNAKVDAVRASSQSVARHLNQVKEIADENQKTILEFSEGTTVVFTGKRVNGSSKITLAVDEELSEISENPVQNKAITLGIKSAVENKAQEITNELTEKINSGIAELSAEIGEAEQNFTAELNSVRQDLTVETGVSGIWQYEKWPNGTLKCFAEKTVAVKPETAWGDAHFYAAVGAIAFPDMFKDVPQLVLSVEDSGANFLVTKRSTEKTNTGIIYVLALQKFTEEQSVRICMSACGKWK
ncbi:MAG: hypothetical protein IIX54_01630 [Clostridia bacterium]|nr:hypothetical protein [Clostridia bacterium]